MTYATVCAALSQSTAWHRFTRHPGFEDVPAPEFSLGLISKLMLDEALLALFERTSGIFWAGEDGVEEYARREVDDLLEYYEAEGWLEDPRGFHPEPPDLSFVKIVKGRRGHHRFEHLKFESGYSPHIGDPARDRWLGYRHNKTAHAWMLRHSNQENRPWLICLHGIGMGTPYTDFPAFRRDYLYEDCGFNVLWYVKPFHGPRAEKRGSHETFNRGMGNLIQTQAQTIWDLRRILRWIHHQYDTSVGVYGLSLGGYAASLLSTLSDDLDLVVAGIPGTDFVDLLSQNVPPVEDEVTARTTSDFWRNARRAMQVVSPFALPCRVPLDRRFIFGGLVDRLTPPAGVRDLWLHWERPRIAWYPGSHLSFLIEPAVTSLLDDAFDQLGK
jgi:hypothetical protein